MPRAVNGMKECSKCKATKDVSEFSKNKAKPDGLGYYCKSCTNAYDKVRCADPEYRERKKAYDKALRANDPEHRERKKARVRARRKAMPAAVYEIHNTITGKTYVGSTTALNRRWNEHRRHLYNGKHNNSALQADHDTYGKDAFEFRIIQEYPSDTSVGDPQLLSHEQQVIDKYIAEGKDVYNEYAVLILEQEQ